MYNPKRVIVQGITGTHGSFHTAAMQAYGTNIVAGTSPRTSQPSVHGVPVYRTIADIQYTHGTIDASVIFVPAPHAKAAIFEAIDAAIPLVICITEGIPVHDMLAISAKLTNSKTRLIGPNCPGIITPGESLLGIIPARITTPGSVAIVSRSGTLTYEAAAELTRQGIGQRYIVGIGGDPISGTSFVDCLQTFAHDPSVSDIILIGEIGGTAECDAADYIATRFTKPVYAYVAGHAAPPGVQMGHAGAILSSAAESAAAKTAYLAERGIATSTTITELVRMIQ